MRRFAYFVLLLAVSWVVMTLTHELGHVLGGWLGGATRVELELRPWRLPYSLYEPNPRPLLMLWAGPVLGVLVPLSAAWLIRRRWAWFVADFCVLANGVYLALAWGSGEPTLDTARLLAAGAEPITIGAFCVATIGVGYVRFRRDCMEVLRSGTRHEPGE